MNGNTSSADTSRDPEYDVIRGVPGFVDTIVVDINSLFKERESLALRYLDKFRLMKYTARGRNPYDLRNKFTLLINELDGNNQVNTLGILDTWLTGKRSRNDTKNDILSFIDTKMKDSTTSNTTLLLLRDIVEIMLTPEILVKILILEDSMVAKLQKLALSGRKIYIAGNMDKDTFRLLKRKYQPVFNITHGEHMSFQCGTVKPQKPFLDSFFHNFGVNPFKTCFIDDQWYDSVKLTGLHVVLGATL